MGRPGQPEDMGNAALFLCQPASGSSPAPT